MLETHHVWNAQRALLVVALVTLSCGRDCRKVWDSKEETKWELALHDAATACPPPTTCTETHTGGSGHEYQVCTVVGEPSYAVGDIVLVHTVPDRSGRGMHFTYDLIARVNARNGSTVTVQFANGKTSERPAETIIRRICPLAKPDVGTTAESRQGSPAASRATTMNVAAIIVVSVAVLAWVASLGCWIASLYHLSGRLPLSQMIFRSMERFNGENFTEEGKRWRDRHLVGMGVFFLCVVVGIVFGRRW